MSKCLYVCFKYKEYESKKRMQKLIRLCILHSIPFARAYTTDNLLAVCVYVLCVEQRILFEYICCYNAVFPHFTASSLAYPLHSSISNALFVSRAFFFDLVISTFFFSPFRFSFSFSFIRFGFCCCSSECSQLFNNNIYTAS